MKGEDVAEISGLRAMVVDKRMAMRMMGA